MKVVGTKLMDVCGKCGQLVRIDKPLFGSLHICTTPEEQRLYGREIARRYALTKAELEKA